MLAYPLAFIRVFVCPIFSRRGLPVCCGALHHPAGLDPERLAAAGRADPGCRRRRERAAYRRAVRRVSGHQLLPKCAWRAFHRALRDIFWLSAGLALLAALCSYLRGKPFIYEEHASFPASGPAAEPALTETQM